MCRLLITQLFMGQPDSLLWSPAALGQHHTCEKVRVKETGGILTSAWKPSVKLGLLKGLVGLHFENHGTVTFLL